MTIATVNSSINMFIIKDELMNRWQYKIFWIPDLFSGHLIKYSFNFRL